jgi:hypothetical protein
LGRNLRGHEVQFELKKKMIFDLYGGSHAEFSAQQKV